MILCILEVIVHTSPAGIAPVSIWKEIVCFDGPGFVQLVHCIEVARWSRVKHLHCITLWGTEITPSFW